MAGAEGDPARRAPRSERPAKHEQITVGHPAPGPGLQPQPGDFAHEACNNDTSEFRLHGDEYILHHDQPGRIVAYARGGPELVAPDQPNYTRAHPQPYAVGYLNWFGGDDPKILKTVVAEGHRGKGVATAMLGFAREIEPRLRHAWGSMTPDGRAGADKTPAHVPVDDLLHASWQDLRWLPASGPRPAASHGASPPGTPSRRRAATIRR